MSQFLVLKIKGKDTIIKCLKPDNSSTYLDTIVKGLDYNDISQKVITVVNTCNTSFVLPAQTLFTQNDNLGSTFSASIKDTIIQANSMSDVPVYYNGKYNGTNNNPQFDFVLNGTTIHYKLIVSVPNTIGTISDFNISLGNRVGYTFTANDFISHHNDIDGDTINSVSVYGNVSTIRYNSNPYIIGTDVPLTDIQQGRLQHYAPDTNPIVITEVLYSVKDSLGNIIN